MDSPQGKDDRTWKERVSDYFVNDGPKAIFIFIWVLGNLAAFGERYYHYRFFRPAPGVPIPYDVLGEGVTLARASAAAIKLNSALLLTTVLRNFLSFIRGTFIGTYLPIDKNIVFHRYIAWTIALFSILHTSAHFFNFDNIANKADPNLLKTALKISARPKIEQLAFTSLPGSTGHILSLIMVFMYTSAIYYIRSPMFNVFWFTHHLFILYYGIASFHGASGLLEKPTFWIWVIGPCVLYAIERTIRVLRGSQDTILQLAVAHPSKVLELQMKKSSFKYKPGQYLFLNCPYVAKYEWHPFTITSAPEEDYVSVHIRIVGDWTGDLWNFINPEKKLGVVQENLLAAPDGSPIFRIDGPFGAASEEVFKFNSVVLCGAGIGVTPFASILKSVRYRLEATGQCAIQKVYFYWISRDKSAFEWFSDLLAALEQENINNFLEIHTYLTGQLSVDEIRKVMSGLDQEQDQITGLQSPTHFGRPNWTEIIGQIAGRHQGQTVGVFFCGPRVLAKALYTECRRYTSSKTQTKLQFHKENF